MSINFKIIADFVFSVSAILNFNLDYAKNMVYSLGNGSILFFDHQNVEFASKIKCLCSKLLAEISTILDFCGGHFEFCQLLNDDRVSSIGFMISGFSSTRINNKTLYVLQNPLQPAAPDYKNIRYETVIFYH